MLTDEQRTRIIKARGKRVRFRVQLASRQEKTARRGMVSLFKIDHKRPNTLLREGQRAEDDRYREVVGEPPLLVGIYTPEVDLCLIDDDIALSVQEYMEARK